MSCHRDKLPKDVNDEASTEKDTKVAGKDAQDADGDVKMEEDKLDEKEMLRFRCVRCKQEAHYAHCELKLPRA